LLDRLGLTLPWDKPAVSLKEIAVPARNPPYNKQLVGRRPELPGVATNSRRIRRGSPPKDRSKGKPTSSRSVSRRHLAVCHGRGDVGYVDQVGRRYTARTLDGRWLGVFRNLKEAADAVSAAYAPAAAPGRDHKQAGLGSPTRRVTRSARLSKKSIQTTPELHPQCSRRSHRSWSASQELCGGDSNE
jgi:hypothetical protein